MYFKLFFLRTTESTDLRLNGRLGQATPTTVYMTIIISQPESAACGEKAAGQSVEYQTALPQDERLTREAATYNRSVIWINICWNDD